MALSPSDLRRAAARAAAPKHRQAHKPYRPVRFNRAMKLCGGLSDRAYRTFWMVLIRSMEVHSGIVYFGNKGLGERVGRCGKTIQRSKPQLEASRLVRVIPTAGGKMLDELGRVTEAATGYELADVLFDPKQQPAPAPAPAAAAVTPRAPSRDAARFLELAARFKSRAGP